MLNIISSLLQNCNSKSTKLTPTELYNEGWLLRLVINWFKNNRKYNHDLCFLRVVHGFQKHNCILPF